eukprot:TRINITY_DN3741_c0_g1_i1.p1 TRINITY_DN3741_c0_g1~~TRINITY_DN3741_c0_g1_i1.p1  ORF type:complete len:510 (+),score=80.17 TRINITY_DN3741_c0_g1_i1:48-1577(+)
MAVMLCVTAMLALALGTTAGVVTTTPLRQFVGSTAVAFVSYHPQTAATEFLSTANDFAVRRWSKLSGIVLQVYTGHTNWVTSLVGNPSNASEFLTASYDGTARVWDSATGTSFVFRGHQNGSEVYTAAYNPLNVSEVASAAQDTALLWHTRSGQVLRSFAGHPGGVIGIEFHPTQPQLLTYGMDATAALWDKNTGALLRRYGDGTRTDYVVFATVCPWDSSQIITLNGSGVFERRDKSTGARTPLLYLQTNNLTWTFGTQQNVVYLMSTTDGNIAAVVMDGFFGGVAFEFVRPVRMYGDNVALHPTNATELLAAYADGSILLWAAPSSDPWQYATPSPGNYPYPWYDYESPVSPPPKKRRVAGLLGLLVIAIILGGLVLLFVRLRRKRLLARQQQQQQQPQFGLPMQGIPVGAPGVAGQPPYGAYGYATGEPMMGVPVAMYPQARGMEMEPVSCAIPASEPVTQFSRLDEIRGDSSGDEASRTALTATVATTTAVTTHAAQANPVSTRK